MGKLDSKKTFKTFFFAHHLFRLNVCAIVFFYFLLFSTLAKWKIRSHLNVCKMLWLHRMQAINKCRSKSSAKFAMRTHRKICNSDRGKKIWTKKKKFEFYRNKASRNEETSDSAKEWKRERKKLRMDISGEKLNNFQHHQIVWKWQ